MLYFSTMSDKYKDTPIEDPKRYFRPNMATDAVVFAILNTDYTNKDLYSGELHVLLIKRDAVQSSGKERPDRGYWALPGGFVAAGESLEECVIRELAEETSINFNSLQKEGSLELIQLKTYSNPKRDAWNFDNNVALGQQRQTMSTAFLVNVPNSSFTLTLAKSDRFLRNSRALHLDMDVFMGALFNEWKTISEGMAYDWKKLEKRKDANKYLTKKFNVDVTKDVEIDEHLPTFVDNDRFIDINAKDFSDASAAAFIPVKDILDGKIEKKRLAFDHNDILRDAVNFFAKQIMTEPLAFSLCEKEFTLAEVRGVYQAFWDIVYGFNKIEIGNFQNKLIKLQDINGNKVLSSTNKRKEQNRFSLNEKGELIKDKGGPAKLFKLNNDISLFNLAITPPKNR